MVLQVIFGSNKKDELDGFVNPSSRSYLSTDNRIELRFTTDSSVAFKGFRAVFSGSNKYIFFAGIVFELNFLYLETDPPEILTEGEWLEMHLELIKVVSNFTVSKNMNRFDSVRYNCNFV